MGAMADEPLDKEPEDAGDDDESWPDLNPNTEDGD